MRKTILKTIRRFHRFTQMFFSQSAALCVICGLLIPFVASADSKWSDYPSTNNLSRNTLINLTLPGVQSETVAASNLLSALSGATTNNGEMWIDPTGTAQGNGCQWAPYHCATWLALSNVLNNETRTNVIWHLNRGAFLAGWPGLPVRAGWIYQGAGKLITQIKMQDAAASGITNSVFSSWVRTDGVQISDLTVDCNLQNQTSPAKVEAIRLIGSRILIENVLAINWGGISNECFVIAVGNGQESGDVATNLVVNIKGCEVTQPANINLTSNGVTAISIQADGRVVVGLVRAGSISGCSVYNVSTSGGLGSPNYFHGYSDGTGGALENCYAFNLTGPGAAAVYNDSWTNRDAVIKNCVFDNVHFGIQENKQDTSIIGLSIIGNVIRPESGGTGVYYFANHGTNAAAFAVRLALLGNVITPAYGATVVTPVSLDAVRPSTLIGNYFQANGGQADMVIYGPSNLVANANPTNAIP